ncbi:MAG: tetratricopeptide repeat protein [Planctomycetes bacterium]|jgi:tetratricopeptide (TPR) repeat protein|nr:tetratricopeptide repeat protein [Planctomycetota bacterium]
MAGLLEILGRAITIETPGLIWHWLSERREAEAEAERPDNPHLDHIIGLMGCGKFLEAREQVRSYLFADPSCCYGRMAATALCLQDGNLKEAMEELNSIYLRHPSNTLALYLLGHCLERLGHQAQAVEFYQDCIKFNSGLQLPAQRLGAIYFKDGRLEDTIAQYEPMKAQYPDDISTLVTLGYLYLAAGRYTEAVETFNTAILIHPDNFMAHDEAIEELICSGQLQEALDQIDVLLMDEPDRADLLAKRADVLAMMGSISDAISLYQQALRICPDFLEATIKLGTGLLKMHADQLAAQQFNRAIEINDKIVEAYTGLAASQKMAGQGEQALNTLSLAAAIQPNSSFLFAETAKLILKAALEANLLPVSPDGRSFEQRVLVAHENHLAQFPNNPDLHYRLGILHMNANRLQQATDCFKAALEINPTFARATTKLAVCLFEMGHKDEALELIKPPYDYDPATLELYYKTALLYCNRIKFASSLINLQHQLEAENAVASSARNLDPATNISIVLQNLGLSDTTGLMWENLCQTAAHATAVHA